MTPWNGIQWKTKLHRKQGVRVYRLNGVVTDSREGLEFTEQVRADLQRHPRSILLDLSQVHRLTSAGVGMLATVYTSAQNAGQSTAIIGLTPSTRHILEMVQVTLFIACFDSEKEALAAFTSTGWTRYPG